MNKKTRLIPLSVLASTCVLLSGCVHMEHTPAVAFTDYPSAEKINLHVGLVLSPEYRSTEWKFKFGGDTWHFPIGENLTTNSEYMARQLFSSFAELDTESATNGENVNAFLIPQVKAFEGSSGAFAWSEAVRTLIVEWSLNDLKNNPIWVDTIRADAKGKLGTAFTQTRNDEQLVGKAIDQLFLKSYEAISQAPEIRKFATSQQH
jgi:hypothetical protein